MNRTRLIGLAAILLAVSAVSAQVCNLKVVTDANPDYTDMQSMIHSISAKWPTDAEKCWAVFYWNHIARRQTAPMMLHGMELADPIRQFNDYGYTMCSTISGNNCSIFDAMGYKVKFWDVRNHTVMEVEFDGKFHMFDNSMTALYTLCDGKTLAGVQDLAKEDGCELSGGKKEPGHYVKYHAVYGSPNGALTGADYVRTVEEEANCFRSGQYRFYYFNWDRGHHYTLNLRPNEMYTRYYHRLEDGVLPPTTAPARPGAYVANPACYVPNPGEGDPKNARDPESFNPRYHIRGNGVWVYKPSLKDADLAKYAYSIKGVKGNGADLSPAEYGKSGEIIFKVEGANVITSMNITGTVERLQGDVSIFSVSTDNGLSWKDVWTGEKDGRIPLDLKLIGEVNGAYEVLVKITLSTQPRQSMPVHVEDLAFETITQVNSKTQPQLKLGKNTVYVDAGEQTGSVVYWPDLQGDKYKAMVVDEKNIATAPKHPTWHGVMWPKVGKEETYVVYRLDTPGEMTRVTYGGRFYNRMWDAKAELLYSLDDGKTWTKSWSLTDTKAPWDTIHYETVDIPAGHKSVLLKYTLYTSNSGDTGHGCSIYAVRMEANYKLPDPGFKPMDVTFSWKERQEDLTTVQRSYTQAVDKVPFTYTINVGGADHPIMESLQVNLKGASPATQPAKYGYSDGKENADAKKFVDRWRTDGKNLALGKPYTVSVPSGTGWGTGDPEDKKLTDGAVGSSYSDGIAYKPGLSWDAKVGDVLATVDLGSAQKCGAFRIHLCGYPMWDAMKNQVKDKVEVLTSSDGKEFASQGLFDLKLRWKDLPANYMWNDEETFIGHNFEMILPMPVEARYVRYKITPARTLVVSEVQVFDEIKYTPFDLRIALPNEKAVATQPAASAK